MLNHLQTYEHIYAFAGNHIQGYPANNVIATSTMLNLPTGIAVDSVGNVYFADSFSHSVLKVTTSTGIITRVAGTGKVGSGYSGDNGPATAASLNDPWGIAVDRAGNIYIADTENNVIRKVIKWNGIIVTVAGTIYNKVRVNGYFGDGGPATSARLRAPKSIAFDSFGIMYISDSGNNVIRKVGKDGIINTVAGCDLGLIYCGNAGTATAATLNNPSGIAFDSLNNLYIADAYNHVIRKVTRTTGMITTVAGTGVRGYTGNNVLATSALLAYPRGIALDSKNNLYIADSSNHYIRKVTAATGIITLVAGTGYSGYSGDDHPASSARLNLPYGVAIDSSTGNIYIADSRNYVVRMVTSAPP